MNARILNLFNRKRATTATTTATTKKIDKKTSAFLQRQEAHEKAKKDKITAAKQAQSEEDNKFTKFKAKEIKPGEMALVAEEMREVDDQKTKERELLNEDRKLESEFLSTGPSMLEREKAGVKTTAALRGEERREKERAQRESEK